jgi:hypothetical protein
MVKDELVAWRPRFIREIRDSASERGLLMAAHEMMVRSNVTIATSGEVDRVQQHSGGLLFIGNHSRQFEFAPLMAILGQMGRVSIKNVAKFYVERQVHWALGTLGTEALLPVYPRLLATDRRNKLNVELGSRLLFRKSLQTLAESARLNQVMVDSAAQELSDDGVVNVFPCGRIVNNMKKPWRPGVGRIIGAVPAADRENVLVVPYQVNNMSRLRLLGAVAARGRGPLGIPQHLDLVFGNPRTAEDIIDLTPGGQHANAAAVTDTLRQQYVQSFSDSP